jgi:hypothetical protein
VLETAKRGRQVLESIDPCHLAERVRAQAAYFFVARGVKELGHDVCSLFWHIARLPPLFLCSALTDDLNLEHVL